MELVKTRRFEVETKGNIPGLCDETLDLSVRGCLSFYGVLEISDEDHRRGLGWGLRRLLEHRVVQALRGQRTGHRGAAFGVSREERVCRGHFRGRLARARSAGTYVVTHDAYRARLTR